MFEIIAHVLLVERGLRCANFIAIQRPETRAIRGKDFVDENDPAIPIAAKLKFRVSNNDRATARILAGFLINSQRDVAQKFSRLATNDRGHLRLADIFVMTGFGFGGWGEYWRCQLLGFTQTSR